MSSSFSEILVGCGYSLSQDGIYSRRPFTGISYSDGEAQEDYILSTLLTTDDLSYGSEELAQKAHDWTSLYHIGLGRGGVFAPITEKLQENVDVLEIGSGCGALTRFLGESDAQVLALEGSLRRAQITKARTRGLNNVSVLHESFESFSVPLKFDIISVIGVLEYSGLFFDHLSPHLEFLNRVKNFLKPNGILILAIENKLGLKYFCGAPEDHVGKQMFGLESLYESRGPRTFGYYELSKILERSGLEQQVWFGAFPDYKFPRVLVSESADQTDSFNVSSLLSSILSSDPQACAYPNFAIERVIHTLVENRLTLPLANSFVVLAGTDEMTQNFSLDKPLAIYTNHNRKKRYQKNLYFSESNSRIVVTTTNPRGYAGNCSTSDVSDFQSKYYSGTLVSEAFNLLLTRDVWYLNDLFSVIGQYLELLNRFCSRNNFGRESDFTFPSILIDAIPRNVVVNSDDQGFVFDLEWSASDEVTRTHLIFRALLSIFNDLTCIGSCIHQDSSLNTVRDVVAACLAHFGASDSFMEIEKYIDAEIYLANEIGVSNTRQDVEALLDREIVRFRSHQRLVDSEQELEKLKWQINLVERSWSWKLTRPFRFVSRLFGK